MWPRNSDRDYSPQDPLTTSCFRKGQPAQLPKSRQVTASYSRKQAAQIPATELPTTAIHRSRAVVPGVLQSRGGRLALLAALLACVILGAWMVYIIKSLSGIDVVEGVHAHEFGQELLRQDTAP